MASFTDLPTDVLEEIASMSMDRPFNQVNREMRGVENSSRVKESRRSHMYKLADKWDTETDVSDMMVKLGGKATPDDLLYYMANSLGFQSFIDQYIPYADLATTAIEEGNLDLLQWLVKNNKLRNYLTSKEQRLLVLVHNQIDTPLYQAWSEALSSNKLEAVKILKLIPMPDKLESIVYWVMGDHGWMISEEILLQVKSIEEWIEKMEDSILGCCIPVSRFIYNHIIPKNQKESITDMIIRKSCDETNPDASKYAYFLDHV